MELEEHHHTGAYTFSMLSYLLLRMISRHRPMSNIHILPLSADMILEVIEATRVAGLDGSARNEEPLVIDPVNGLGSQVLMAGNFE